MNKKILYLSFSIILIFTLITLLNNKSKTFIKDGIEYALTVNGINKDSFPPKDVYHVNVECENAKGKWDYGTWKLIIDDIIGKVTCKVDFESIEKKYFNNYIISLAGKTQGIGELVHETFTSSANELIDTGYRFEGLEPNNYVMYNDEYWRIIGVFDENSHGVTDADGNGLKLVKIIRNETLGAFAWSKNNLNDWSMSSLKTLLNNYYIKKSDGTDSDYCYGFSTTLKTNCDFTQSGIDSIYKNMIKKVTWYLGGASTSYNSTLNEIYEFERDINKKYSSNFSSIEAEVGLMYASDFGYGTLSSQCPRTAYLYDILCSSNNWFYSNTYEWVLSPNSNRGDYAMYIDDHSGISSSFTRNGYLIRPTLYLNENVYVLDGDGSSTNPYIIGMD